MWVLHALQHLELIVHHLLVALDILLQDDLDRDLAGWTIGFPHDAICSCSQGPSEFVP